jgi:hypothetical protein
MAKVAGSIWVEGNDLHYIDQFNREWYNPGFFIKTISAGPKPGSIWQDSGTTAGIYWVNEAGTAIYRTPVNFVKKVPLGMPITSLWVDGALLYWLWYFDGSNNQELNNHWDVALVNTHGDSHVDGAHIDTPHNDVAHVDAPSVQNHNDYHNDVPHADFWDSSHGDAAGTNFGDHNDCTRTFANPYLTVHYDCWSSPYGGSDPNPYGPTHYDYHHYDSSGGNQVDGGGQAHYDYGQHWDFPHTDNHSDSPHQDVPPWIHHGDYWDIAGHQDTPHTDIAHNDAAHQDSHVDSHGDTPHTDQPVLIGP